MSNNTNIHILNNKAQITIIRYGVNRTPNNVGISLFSVTLDTDGVIGDVDMVVTRRSSPIHTKMWVGKAKQKS
jgi:hypothetical protein